MQLTESHAKSFVKAAQDLAPHIRSAQEEMDRERRIPDDLARLVEKAGIYQLFLPASMGGPQLHPVVAFEAIEEVSRVEASVGWCGLLSNGGALFTGNFTPEAAHRMFGNPPEFRCAGSFRPLGESRPVPGGYRVSGRWDYASGIANANWLFVNSRVVDDDGPRLTEAGRPDTVMLFTPAETATVHDTWHVVGLCGTGSNDFVLEDVFVPTERSFRLYDPPLEAGYLYHPRTMLTAIWVLVSAVALGAARGAMDAFKELACESGTTISTTLLRDRPHVQSRVGEAEAIISGARALSAGRHEPGLGLILRGHAPAQSRDCAGPAGHHPVHPPGSASRGYFVPCRRDQCHPPPQRSGTALARRARGGAAWGRPVVEL